MAEPLRFHPLVADDLESAASWYDENSPELGNRFRSAVDSRFDAVRLMPESFGMADPPMRACLVRRFPYLTGLSSSIRVARPRYSVYSTLPLIRRNGEAAKGSDGDTAMNIRSVASRSPSIFRDASSRYRIDHSNRRSLRSRRRRMFFPLADRLTPWRLVFCEGSRVSAPERVCRRSCQFASAMLRAPQVSGRTFPSTLTRQRLPFSRFVIDSIRFSLPIPAA